MSAQTNIPKTIHYCWFGGNPLPESVLKYIESWKKYCPDYEIKEWNESNFDVNSNAYVREAFEAKKWAFVSDYARLYALVEDGGIYLDTDVEITKPLDKFLHLRAFAGCENEEHVSSAILACEKGFPLFDEILHSYDSRHFKLEGGSYDLTTNVITITDICSKNGFVPGDQKQEFAGLTVFPKDWFYPKDNFSGRICLTENTHAIHNFSGTWIDPGLHRVLSTERYFKSRINGKAGVVAGRIASLPFRVYNRFKELGLKGLVSYSVGKLKGEKNTDG